MILEFIKFIIYTALIVLISKYILVTTLRKLAENLNLKPTTVGNVAGFATSVPELLTIVLSSFNGLIETSIVNVLSSNIINFIQYLLAILLNKNKKAFKNQAIRMDILLVLITIIIPIFIMNTKIALSITMVPLFLLFYALFGYLNNNAHKLYLQKEDKELFQTIEKEKKWEKGNRKKTIKYLIYLFLTAIILFIIGNLLGDTLQNLCYLFQISETILGILLGFATSVPELITFFESQKHYKTKTNDDILGVVEATNNLLTSNMMNLFIIQSIGILIYTLTTK